MAGRTQASTQRTSSQIQSNKDRVEVLSAFTHPLDEARPQTEDESDVQAA